MIPNASRPTYTIPGIQHQTLAGGADALKALEIWAQTLQPRAETPIHYHECEEVVIVQQGTGRATIAGEDLDFGPGATLIIPPRVIHKLANVGNEDMFLIAALSETPARVFTPEGRLMPLPWQT
jgi:mannose-6-phosphate isomerase-like protein (cupin superfamily)